MTKIFSTRQRPMHMGPFPMERLVRGPMPDLSAVPVAQPLEFRRPTVPASIVNAMGEYQAMMDVIRGGIVNPEPGAAPTDPQDRANHMKAFGYFQDAAMMGLCRMPQDALLPVPTRNPDIDRLADDIRTKQTKTLASGIDEIMAGLRESIEKLVDQYERGRPDRFKVDDMPHDMKEAHFKGLVGFEMKISKIESSYKLSQNRNDKDHANVISQLEKEENSGSIGIAKAMNELRKS